MEANRRQPGMLEGLSRFLVQHERCGAGFDVAHPAGLGSGRVSITCRGCGARHEYATATIEIERELRVEAASRRAPEQAPAQERPGAGARSREEAKVASESRPEPAQTRQSASAARPDTGAAGRAPTAPMPARERGALATALRNLWRSPRTTPVLLIIAASALGFAVVRQINESSEPEPATTAPAPAPPPSVAPTPVPEAPSGAPEPAPAPPGTTTVRTERFSIEVPRGWSERASAGGLLVEPPGGGRVNVQIFFERSPQLSAIRMARQTRAFMARAVPGGRLFANRVQIAGRPAYELTARGPGETAIAVNVLRGPHRYLIVRRIFAGAKPHVSQAAGRVVMSFRPR